MNKPTEAEQIEITCRMLERTMHEAQVEERRYEMEENKARALKEGARVRRDTTKSLILLYNPTFIFSEPASIALPVTEKLPKAIMVSAMAQPEAPDAPVVKSNRKETYGKHTKLARSIMAIVKEGDFPRIVSVGKSHSLLPSSLLEKDANALRGALHGLARRGEIGYDNGVFTYKAGKSSV